MAGYPYGGNPQYPSPQNHIYPQLYNPANAPSPAMPGQPSAMAYPTIPGQNPHFPYQPGFAYPPAQGLPGQPHPAAMAYPGVHIVPTPTLPNVSATAPIATAPPSYEYGFGVPTATPLPTVEWIPTTPGQAISLSDKAIVAGYEGHDGSPLWVIRARFEGDIIPGKLAIKHKTAYVPWGGNENTVRHIEVCCARPEKVRWVQSKEGEVPPNAVSGGTTASGEVLYIGRANYNKSLTPGKVHPSHKTMYISFAGKEVPFKVYEILCAA